MYTPSSKTLAMTGATGAMGMATQTLSLVALVLILLGACMIVSKLVPRFAFEKVPVVDSTGTHYKWRPTMNGQPLRWLR